MGCGASKEETTKDRPLPKRGQVKVSIAKTLIGSALPKACCSCGGDGNGCVDCSCVGVGGRRMTDEKGPLCGYNGY